MNSRNRPIRNRPAHPGWLHRLRFLVFGLVLTAPILASPQPGRAESGIDDLDRRTTAVSQQVMSPFCPGRSLNDCPSSKAHDLKERIRKELEAGVPEDRILDQLFEQYGEEFRAVPRYEGFGKVAWWAPVAFLLAGFVLAVYVASRRNRATPAPDRAAEGPLSDAVRRRIEDELGRME